MIKDKKKGKISALELAARLEADHEFVARRNSEETEISERWKCIQDEQKILLTELRAAGIDIDYVGRLINTNRPYPQAVPILLRHLQLPYSDVTIETIARALAAKEAQRAWPILVEQYRKAPQGFGLKAPGDTKELKLGAKDGLAVALSATVTDEMLSELISLARDRSHASSRLLLLLGLKKLRNRSPVVRRAIEELATDPDLAKEIASWKRR